MSRFYGYHYFARYHADGAKPAARPATRHDDDGDKGALLIIAIVAIPSIIVASIAVLAVM